MSVSFMRVSVMQIYVSRVSLGRGFGKREKISIILEKIILCAVFELKF